jgi:hypothetical protein
MRSSGPRVKSTAVEEKAVSGGRGVILIAPRSRAARISRSDRNDSVAQAKVLPPHPQALGPCIRLVRQFDQHPWFLLVIVDDADREKPLVVNRRKEIAIHAQALPLVMDVGDSDRRLRRAQPGRNFTQDFGPDRSPPIDLPLIVTRGYSLPGSIPNK